jgi:hypothetical protein
MISILVKMLSILNKMLSILKELFSIIWLVFINKWSVNNLNVQLINQIKGKNVARFLLPITSIHHCLKIFLLKLYLFKVQINVLFCCFNKLEK